MRHFLLMMALVGCGEKVAEPLIADPIVEKAIRKYLDKSTGELTEADLEMVRGLSLRNYNKLTDVKGLEKLTQLRILSLNNTQLTDVKGLEKLTQLRILDLRGNPDLTKVQIDELKKALPFCKIIDNTTKQSLFPVKIAERLGNLDARPEDGGTEQDARQHPQER